MENDTPKLKVEWKLPPCTLNIDALRDIAELLDRREPQQWSGKRRDDEVSSATFDTFIKAAARLRELDEFSVTVGDLEREGVRLQVAKLGGSVQLVTTAGTYEVIERDARLV